MSKVLIISQSFLQIYYNVFKEALPGISIDLITGDKIDCESIIKAPSYAPQSMKSKLISWLAFYRFMMRWSKNCHEKYSFIFCTSNPPINSYIGLRLKKKFNVPFIYLNWDIFPQIIERNLNNPITKIICKAWNKWNIKNYSKIDKMITIGSKVAESIQKATNPGKVNISVISLCVDTEILKPVEKGRNKFLIKHKLEDKFIVLFSGKMGIGHNVELILEAATKIENVQDIMFVFIGKGPKYQIIDCYIKKHNASNIRLFPWQDEDMHPYSISCGRSDIS